MINIAVIGSTGSIGTQALKVASRHPDRYKVSVIVAGSNVNLLKKQYEEFHPDYVGVYDNAAYALACEIMPKDKLKCGVEALTFAAEIEKIDVIVVAVSGMIGLHTVEAAIKNNKKIALANKESLVAGGELVNKLLECSSSVLLPIDSEHSAIMQCLKSGRRDDVKRLILTASGGPFFGYKKGELDDITPERAIKHPTWNMGMKISVDSATMMNKALEIIEARYLFGIDKIDYIIHRESIVHSMVEFCDGAVVAQMSNPNMELPIQYALSYPERLYTDVPQLNLKTLTFSPPDEENFPAPKLAMYCMDKGKDYCCKFNAANEACVRMFFDRKIKFTDIYKIVEKVVLNSNGFEYKNVAELFECYAEAGKSAEDIAARLR